MKRLVIIIIILLLGINVNGQVKIGDNPTNIDNNAIFEIESTGKGMLMPRLTTAQRDAMGSNITKGLLIFNTDKNCYEVYLGVGSNGADSNGWKNMCAANIPAVFTGGTLSCTGTGTTLFGDYYESVEMAATNTKIVTVTVTGAGDYSATTDEVNGVSFSSVGTIQTTGAGVKIKLTATGMPENSGTYTYTVSLAGQTCTFNITYGTAPADILSNAINCLTGTPATGTYSTDNVMVNAVHLKAIQVTPVSTGFYKFYTDVVNGVSFSVTGNFTSGQINNAQTLNLQASGIPLKTGTYTYTVSGVGVYGACTFNVTVIGKDYLLANLSATTLTSMSSGKDVTFSAISARSNGVTVSGANITLKAGKTYLLEAQLGGTLSSNGAWLTYAFVNSSNTSLPNSTSAVMLSIEGGYSNQTVHQNAMAVVTVGNSDMVVKLRIVNSSGSGVLYKDRSYLIVREIRSSAGYVFATAATGQTSIGFDTDISFTQKQNNSASVSGVSFTLKAGKTYVLRANLFGAMSAWSATLYPQWVDNTNTPLSGNTYQFVRPVLNGFSASTSGDAFAIVTVGGSDMTVKLRVSNLGSGTITVNTTSYAFVEEIESIFDYVGANLGAASTNPQIISSGTNVALTNIENRGASVSGSTLTLKAGKTYLLNAQILGSSFSSSSGALAVNWETTGDVALSNSALVYALNRSTSKNNCGGTPSVFCIYKVGSIDATVRLQGGSRTTGGPGLNTIYSFMTAIEL